MTQVPPLSLSLEMQAVALVLEGLEALPLGRSYALYSGIRAAAEKHLADFKAQQQAAAEAPPVKPKRTRKPKPAQA